MSREFNTGPSLAAPSNIVDRLEGGERSAHPSGAAARERPFRVRAVSLLAVSDAKVAEIEQSTDAGGYTNARGTTFSPSSVQSMLG